MNTDVDMTGMDHSTTHPSNSDARAMQVPFTGDIILPSMTLFDGTCSVPSWLVGVA